ncbi:RNA polymerase sigma factor [Catalinimonas niigatensis]|uniref:RNA polymerase sigma factor n=1 Tax=Catalinimonas niigatensis TaxID=1397264 RepID=UPI002666478D|nr:sigma-70 family RNA polymerase sigma factor [Catalinimonas niigatensis]WPP51189.1 sigma-70 family RNA polymerase sigma factor [Catalinimonas niigatensis]
MSDNDIIANVREGNSLVTTHTYQLYRKEFIRWMKKKYHCQEDDAKELYQLAFLTFYNQIQSGKLSYITSSIKTYLFGIGKYKFYQQQKGNDRFEHDIDEKRIGAYAENSSITEEQENQYQWVEANLKKLGSPCRQILVMVYYEKRSMEYITEKLGYKNADTAKNQKYKCMCRLRKMLEFKAKVDD